MTLTYVSLFSGIEAFSVAASRIPGVDWQPVFFSEIDPFPCAVLAHRFPHVPNLGDICKIKIHDGTATNGTTTITLPRNGIDILAGGSPCQDVSVAGRRAGMSEGSGTRSSLAFEYARLVEELRPRVILWENVPGVLSSNNGRDFLAFQRSLVERGYSLAYRVLDAQYTRVDSAPRAVPQRRKRVWLVGCLGDDGRIPAQILFECPGLLGDTAPRREAGQGFAAPALYGPARHDRGGSRAIETAGGGVPCVDIAQTIMARTYKGVGARNGEICGAVGVAPLAGDVSPTLDASYPGHLNAQDLGKPPVVPAAFCESGFAKWHEGVTPLRVGGERPSSPTYVVVTSAFFDGADCSPTLRASNGTPGQSNQEIFSQGGAYLARVATYENHAQDSRVKEVAQTRNTFDNGETRSQEVVVAVGFSHTASGAMLDCRPKQIGVPCKSCPGGENAVVIGFAQNQREEVRDLADAATALAAEPGTHQQTYAAIGVFNMGGNKASAGTDCSGATPSLLSGHGTDPHAVVIGFKGGQSANGGLGVEVENAPTLSHEPSALEPTVAIRTANTGANGHGVAEETTRTLNRANGQAVATRGVVYPIDIMNAVGRVESDNYGLGWAPPDQPQFTLSRCHSHGVADCDPPLYIVRRLTPGECESLQFFPQGWTRIPYCGKPAAECPDSPRYKALGNSWATNCAEWILLRIVAAFRLGMI